MSTRAKVALERFLIETAKQHEGFHLMEFVQIALQNGFRGDKTGDLTATIKRSLKKLCSRGVIHTCPAIHPEVELIS